MNSSVDYEAEQATRFRIAALVLLCLRLNLTSQALVPRLSTGYLLGFTGCGFSPHYTLCTELAHSYFYFTTF
jgi:hypothetical protein